jgi:hypothetical protein
MTTTTRALLAALFSFALAAVLVTGGCGSIKEVTPDASGPGGASAGGTTGSGGTAGTGVGGTTGAAGSSPSRGGADGSGSGGAAGSSAGRGGTDGAGQAGRGGAGQAGRGGATGSAGAGGRGGTGGGTAGAAGSSAGRGGTGATAGAGGSSAGRGGAGGNAGAGGRGGAGGACACPSIYMPVCGVDGKTYSNSCEAQCMNVAVAYQGVCADECKTDNDCIQYPDGVGDCCGHCLPRTAPMPPTIACIRECDMPTICPCKQGKCTAVPRNSTAASR